MKALSKNKADRYQTVESLRRDIELFLEGRSVSAKEDTKWETLVKFVKRNKGLSAGVGVSFLVLLLSLVFIGQAWLATGKAYAAYQEEQEDKAKRMREAVPAFLRAAELALRERQFDDALKQATVALNYAPEDSETMLLKGKLLLVQQHFAEAREMLGAYLKKNPKDKRVRELLDASARLQPDDTTSLVVLAEVFSRHQEHALADGMLRSLGKNALAVRKELLVPFPAGKFRPQGGA